MLTPQAILWASVAVLAAGRTEVHDFACKTNGDTTVTITGYTGSGGVVTIPSTTNGLQVTSIGDNAFENCTSLTSVTIPNSVTNIGNLAFVNFRSLTGIVVDASNPVFSSAGGVLFDKSQITLIQFPRGKAGSNYAIPDGVTNIGVSAFGWCTNLTSVTIPNSVTNIGDSAFYECIRLTSVTIPNSVTSIGSFAFRMCSLTNVTIPNSVTSIGSGAFYGCSSLTSVTIPSSVITIWHWAFENCTSLTGVTIPNSVTSIGDGAFGGFTSLTGIAVNASNPAYSDVGGVLFDKSQTTLIQYPKGKKGSSCAIFDGVTSIGRGAFFDCSNLTSVIIPSSITSIGQNAFAYCHSLTSVTIPSSVISIGSFAFEKCTSLTGIAVNASNPVFSCAGGVLFDKSQTTLIGCPGGKAGSNYAIPDGVTNIGVSAFGWCTNLTSVTIPSNVTTIWNWAFENCTSLTSVCFKGNAPSLGGDDVFAEADKAKIYYLPETTGWSNSFGGRPTAIWNLETNGTANAQSK